MKMLKNVGTKEIIGFTLLFVLIIGVVAYFMWIQESRPKLIHIYDANLLDYEVSFNDFLPFNNIEVFFLLDYEVTGDYVNPDERTISEGKVTLSWDTSTGESPRKEFDILMYIDRNYYYPTDQYIITFKTEIPIESGVLYIGEKGTTVGEYKIYLEKFDLVIIEFIVYLE